MRKKVTSCLGYVLIFLCGSVAMAAGANVEQPQSSMPLTALIPFLVGVAGFCCLAAIGVARRWRHPTAAALLGGVFLIAPVFAIYELVELSSTGKRLGIFLVVRWAIAWMVGFAIPLGWTSLIFWASRDMTLGIRVVMACLFGAVMTPGGLWGIFVAACILGLGCL